MKKSMPNKKKSYASEPDAMKLTHLFEIIEMLGLIESFGIYFKRNKRNKEGISEKEIEGMLALLYEVDSTRSRRFKTSKAIYNKNAKYSKIIGDKKGSYFVVDKDFSLKIEPIYRSLFTIGIAQLVLKDFLNLDIFNQFFKQQHPIAFLFFLYHAINKKYIISMTYQSDRNDLPTSIKRLVPMKITFRDGHWILIVWNIEKEYFVQYLIHSILSCEYYKRNSNSDPEEYKGQMKNFNLKEFYENSFGLSVLQEREVYTIDISVPKDFRKKIEKRRREGEWIDQEKIYIWRVKTYDPNEVFDYIFRWNGNLKIIAPLEIKMEFQKKVKLFLD